MRDAIVYSGSGWESCNVMERLSIALTKLGAKVLYCDNPVSRLKGKPPEIHEVEPGIFRFRPTIFGHRLNEIPALAAGQSRMVSKQIVRAAVKLHLRKPMFFYPYTGRLLPVCSEMKRRGYFLVYTCMDFPQIELKGHVSVADLTLMIQRAAIDSVHAIAGDRAVLIPQFGPPQKNGVGGSLSVGEPAVLQKIPHPRLIYAGALQNRVTLPVVRAILETRPQWQFLYFGSPDNLSLPNSHALPWMNREELMRVIQACEVGFMPYDRNDPVQNNCVPLKLLDYFGVGMPVVSTPIVSMLELKNEVYVGDTVGELTEAIECALSESAESPKRARRMEIAREHSLDKAATLLGMILPINC
jgi:hypothetical protein